MPGRTVPEASGIEEVSGGISVTLRRSACQLQPAGEPGPVVRAEGAVGAAIEGHARAPAVADDLEGGQG